VCFETCQSAYTASAKELSIVTPVTLGAAFLGARPGADALADALVASEFDVDTSNTYMRGQSEQLLGRAIARGGLTGQVFSKADRHLDTNAFDGERVYRSAEESLERLGLDHLPLYQLHDPYVMSFEEAMAPGGAVPALLELRDQGVVGAIGIAAGQTALVHRYVLSGVFDVVLSHNRFTLVDRAATATFEAARSLGMTVFNAAPFGGGILADPSGRKTTYGYQQNFSPEFAAHLAALRELALEWEVDLAAAALQFSMRSPLVDTTVVGISSLARLAALDGLIAASVPDEFFGAVEQLGPPPASPND
jgi:D-threo-aldose 1-dehydrogenase